MEIKRSPVMVAGQPHEYAKGCAVTGAKGFIMLSGSVGIDANTGEIPERPGKQAELAMENIKARLEEYGSSIKNILFVRLYIKGEHPNGILNNPVFLEIREEIEKFWEENYPEFLMGNNPPASTLLGVTSLARPEYLVEIEVVAAIE